MPEVLIAGTGLACALGPDPGAAIAALRQGGVRPSVLDVAPGVAWPVQALPAVAHADWLAAARERVLAVVAQCGPLERYGPLFVASSSRDIGLRERSMDFSGDLHMFADAIGQWLGWRGPVLTISTACTSAANALLAASGWLRAGEAASALVLGIELPNRFTPAGFGALQLLASADPALRETQRGGLLLGQAVAAVHLRTGGRADGAARWRIAGGANVVDGRDPTGTHPEAVAAMCAQALRASGVGPADIDLLKPHASPDDAGDGIEMSALREIFGGDLPPSMSFKHSIGHTLGAAGAAELVLLTACLEAGIRPEAAPAHLRHVLLHSLGFGGGHAALVLEDLRA